ncbi:hypothetical protein DFH11DRAFT_1638035 [Phellopilus nigrolimitatus]|nr:hypothetical protein DFH11DRAFT_1638035 [Phellopilus nigrolimitatus]
MRIEVYLEAARAVEALPAVRARVPLAVLAVPFSFSRLSCLEFAEFAFSVAEFAYLAICKFASLAFAERDRTGSSSSFSFVLAGARAPLIRIRIRARAVRLHRRRRRAALLPIHIPILLPILIIIQLVLLLLFLLLLLLLLSSPARPRNIDVHRLALALFFLLHRRH